MSKGGGAGKVYFVLYLAVVLELLIIIVERDEAEQGLLQKQKETMRIVESILSQLQSGAGTEGINTRPQDEIVIPPPGINIKDVMGAELKPLRKYIVEVGVTDISADLKRKEGEAPKDYEQRVRKLVQLGNVEEIEYQIFYTSSEDPNNAPVFPSEEEIKKMGVDFMKFSPSQTVQSSAGTTWEFLGVRKLKLDEEQTFNNLNLQRITSEAINPVYPRNLIQTIGPSYIPSNMPDDSSFFYSAEETNKHASMAGGADLKKRSFVVNFQPPSKQGWYKLRFASRTNRILGVRADAKPSDIDDAATVNIGTVQLTVRDLNKVKRELTAKLDKYGLPAFESLVASGDVDKFDDGLKKSITTAYSEENASEIISKIKLYGYIAKLLAPGQSINFAQNKGSIEFNIRVVTPHPAVAEPVAGVPTYTACFDRIPAVFEFSVSPYQGSANIVTGRVIDVNGASVASIMCKPSGDVASAAKGTGGAMMFRGTVDKELSPGKYKIEVTHKLASKSKVETGDLEIFKTGLTSESENQVKNNFDYAFYGNNVVVNAIPNSGGKIKSNTFRIYLKTDADPQRPPFEGLSMPIDQGVPLTAKANTITLRITWVQPITNQEIDIFPEKTVEVKQSKPKINPADKTDNVVQSGNRIKVQVRNLKVKTPDDGAGGKAEVQLKADKLQVENRLQGIVEINSDPIIEKEEDTYTISFDANVTLPRGTDNINGYINIPVRATAINKTNGKRSDVEDKVIKVNIKYEQERGGRRSPGGGGAPPSGGRKR